MGREGQLQCQEWTEEGQGEEEERMNRSSCASELSTEFMIWGRKGLSGMREASPEVAGETGRKSLHRMTGTGRRPGAGL